VRFVDDTGRNDRVIATLTNLPRPEAATEYELWLTGGPAPLSAGRFAPDEAGVATVDYRAPEAANLVGRTTARWSRSSRCGSGPGRVGRRAAARRADRRALTHVRHVLVSFPATPNARGFGLGMRELAEQALRFAGLQSGQWRPATWRTCAHATDRQPDRRRAGAGLTATWTATARWWTAVTASGCCRAGSWRAACRRRITPGWRPSRRRPRSSCASARPR
jgi:hypothetical protein